MATRRLTARQLDKALTEIDRQIDRMEKVLEDFNAFPVLCPDGIPESVGDAWNAAHDALAALQAYRREVELNPAPIPAAEYGTWLLVQQNID